MVWPPELADLAQLDKPLGTVNVSLPDVTLERTELDSVPANKNSKSPALVGSMLRVQVLLQVVPVLAIWTWTMLNGVAGPANIPALDLKQRPKLEK